MKPRLNPVLAAMLVAAASALLIDSPVQAASFTFLQAGYADGATISGSFAGVDLDNDGWLVAEGLSSFSLAFSGNHAVQAFVHDRWNIDSFAYGIGQTSRHRGARAERQHPAAGRRWRFGASGAAPARQREASPALMP